MKHFISIIFTALCFWSCSDFLEEHKTTSLSDNEIYDSEQALECNINGCYLSLHGTSLWKGGTFNEYLGSASAMLLWGGDRTSDEWLDAMYLTKYSTSNAGNKNIWIQIWAGINRCNRLLDNLPGSPVEAAYKTEIEAEARLLRAIFYYTAVRLWGDVPIIRTSPVSSSELYNPREAWYKVYKFVLEDLTFAENYMRDPTRVEAVTPRDNRPSKWAATSFKASVYLTIGSLLRSPLDNFWDYTKDAELIASGRDPRSPDFSSIGINNADDAFALALETATKVMEEGPYSLVPDYRVLFRWTEPDDWFLPEDILVLTSTNTAGMNHNSVYMLPPFPPGTANFSTPNTNAGRVRPSRFMIDNFIRAGGGRRGNQGTYNKYVYCSTTDPRYDATFIVSYVRQDTGKSASYYPTEAKIPTTSSPFIRKYLDPSYDVSNGKADFYLMRYAEIYLIAAEASAELSTGKGDEDWNRAISLINELRLRARKSVDVGEAICPPDFVDDDFDTKEDLVNAIMWERIVEMVGEGHEFFDTHRRGATWLLDNIANPANDFYFINRGTSDPEVNCAYVEYFYKGALDRGYIFPDSEEDLRKSLLLAYPESELRLNTSTNQQNDFYWQ